MAESPEELALDLSRAAWVEQTQTEAKLRERATGVLQAASIVIPVAAIAIHEGTSWAALPFGMAAVAYALCAWQCVMVLYPRNFATGVHGSQLLADAKAKDATLAHMQERAAGYLDLQHVTNGTVLAVMAKYVQRSVVFLAAELIGLAAALVVTLVA